MSRFWMRPGCRAVVMGASAGGLSALGTLLPALGDFPVPVLVVQHFREQAGNPLVRHFRPLCTMRVVSGEAGPLERAIVFAPPGLHLLVSDERHLELSDDPRVMWSRPSIDVLFQSAAEVFGRHLIAVVLTGANADGADGAAMVRDYGGRVLVQDPEEAEVATMPRAALERVPDAEVLGLGALAERILELANAEDQS